MISKPDPLEIEVNGLLAYWCNELVKDKSIEIESSSKVNSHMFCSEITEGKEYRISYHPENIKKWSLPMTILGIFHEIGHAIHGWNGSGRNTIQDVIDEYVAERYALDTMKKYYPECLDEVISKTKSDMKNSRWIGTWPTHFLAYTQIEEYQ